MSKFLAILKEPLTHFVALAALILAIKPYFDSGIEGQAKKIFVPAAKIEQLEQIFVAMRQRPPTDIEKAALIDDYVVEEIYYREAKKLGLDQDDGVIRRRLRQKMEFLAVADVDGLEPSDAELGAFLIANAASFEAERKIAFEQILLSRERRGERAELDALAALDALLKGTVTGASALGDSTLLPATLPLAGQTEVASIFGQDFADELFRHEAGRWFGPITSEYGIHLVKITDSAPGRLPELAQIRDRVKNEWLHGKRREAGARHLETLKQSYQVIMEPGP